MALPHKFGFIQGGPNFESRHQTPASLLLDMHWHNLQLVNRWTWDRYARLCNFLNMTPWELASAVQLRHESVEPFQRIGKMQCHGKHQIALLLTLLEAQVLGPWTKDVIENPFPPLPDDRGTETPLVNRHARS